jgi:beta-lactamase regulating signal transducer with metallopeptidase domain
LNRSGQTAALPTPVWSDSGELLGHAYLEKPLHPVVQYFNEHLPLIVAVWLAGMVFFLLKMVGGLLYIQRLRSRYVWPMSEKWQQRLEALSGQLEMRKPIRLMESVLVKVPVVIGWLKPIILMPAGAVNNLSPEQVEAIIAHELAHIVRHDYLLNIFQSFIEIP